MASFTDEVMRFNPYLEQMPVDDYIKVGMLKQQQYQHGVQTVQGAIDHINNLPIVNEADKAYVRNAMQQLQEKAQNVVGGDFSNQQLVNQLTGATRLIARDKNVQNAVQSAQFIQKEQEFIDQQRKEGKSNASNEWDWQRQYQGYLNNKTPGQLFQYKYTPYRDVKKKAIEILKAINPNARISDNIFDAEGKLSDVLLREQFKGVNPEQIKSALLAGLDQGDLKQLSIDGQYSMSSYTQGQLAQAAVGQLSSQKAFLTEKKNQLLGTKAAIKSTAEQNKIDEKVAELDRALKGVSDQETFYIDKLTKGDLDTVRAQLHSQQFLNQFGNAFAYTEISQTYENNPAAAIAMQRATMNQDWTKFLAEMEWKQKAHEDEMEVKRATLKLAQEEAGGAAYGGTPLTVDVSQLPDVNMLSFKEKTVQAEQGIAAAEKEFLTTQGKDAAWLAQQRKLYDQKPSALDPLVKNYFDTREAQEKDVNTNKTLIANLEREADLNVGPSSKVFEGKAGVKYVPNKGDLNTGTTFTAEELYDLSRKFSSFNSNATGANVGGVIQGAFDARKAAAAFTTPKEKLFLQMRMKWNEGKPLTQGEKAVMDRATEVFREVEGPQRDIIAQRTKWIDGELAKRTGETQRNSFIIPVGKTAQRDQARNKVNEFVANAKDMDKSFGSGTKADYEMIKQMNDDEKTTYSLIVKDRTAFGDAKFWMRVQNKDGDYQDIPMDIATKRSIFGTAHEDDASASPIRTRMRLSNNGTTNLNGIADPVKSWNTALIGRNDLPAVKTFSVKGDVVQQNGQYAVMLYIFDPKTKQYVRKTLSDKDGRLMDEAQAEASLSGISDALIYQLLYEEAPTAEKLKEIQKLTEKPLD